MGLPLSNCETSLNLHWLRMLPNPELINKREVLSCLRHHFYSLSTIFFSELFVHILNITVKDQLPPKSVAIQQQNKEISKTWTRMHCCFCVSVGLTMQSIVALGEPGCVVHILNVCCCYDYSKVTNCFQNIKLVKQWFRVFKQNEKHTKN